MEDVIRLIKLKLGDLLLSQLSPGCVQLCAVFVFDSRYLLYPGEKMKKLLKELKESNNYLLEIIDEIRVFLPQLSPEYSY